LHARKENAAAQCRLRVGRTMLDIHRGTPCENIHPGAWYTPFLKTLTAKWSWYRRGCGYQCSILDFMEMYLHRDFEDKVTSSLPNPLFKKVKDGTVVVTAATVPRPFCSQSFKKWGVPYSGMNILAGCTKMNF